MSPRRTNNGNRINMKINKIKGKVSIFTKTRREHKYTKRKTRKISKEMENNKIQILGIIWEILVLSIELKREEFIKIRSLPKDVDEAK